LRTSFGPPFFSWVGEAEVVENEIANEQVIRPDKWDAKLRRSPRLADLFPNFPEIKRAHGPLDLSRRGWFASTLFRDRLARASPPFLRRNRSGFPRNL
jgi:hypothetical protein